MNEKNLRRMQTAKHWRRLFTGSINYSGVLLIDMQEEFLKRFEDQRVVDDLISAQLEVLEYCRKNSFKVFVLEYRNSGETDKIIKNNLGEIDYRTVVKKCNDGFLGTDLVDILSISKISHVYIMGINMGSCVLTTAESAVFNGFEVSTAKTVISQPKYCLRGSLWVPDFSWFEKNTNLYKDHKNLDEILK